MGNRAFMLAALAAALLVFSTGPAYAEEEMEMPGYGHMPGYGMGYGNMGYGPGYGMGRGQGYGMGYGMMGPGMMGPGMMGMGYGMCQDMGCSMGLGCGHGPTWPEYLDFLRKTRDLRKRMHMKIFEYTEAMRDPETARKELDKLRDELNDLRRQLERAYMKMLMEDGK